MGISLKSFLFLIIFCSFEVVRASTIIVCKDCATHSVSVGISLAQDKDTVLVKKGTYKEAEIQLSKSIYLIGEDYPILDAENTSKSILLVKADNFVISGFQFQNIKTSYTKEVAAIFLSSGKSFEIKNNRMIKTFYAFIIQNAKYGLIQGNKISGEFQDESAAGNGIHVWKSSKLRIESNNINGMRDGIYFEFVNESFISDNTSENNLRYGLHFMFSNHNEYHHNEFKDNGAGVAVMFSKFINMHHNTFHYNWGSASYGLLLKEIYDAEIHDNIFEQNTIGINIDGCNRISYKNNHFIRNGWALKFTGGCYANVFNYNNFQNNSFDLSYNSRLNDNVFEANYWSEYTGYDLDKNGIGDIAYRPVKLFSYIVNQTPEALILLRSLFVDIINFSEKVAPIFTPDNLLDNKPLMKPISL